MYSIRPLTFVAALAASTIVAIVQTAAAAPATTTMIITSGHNKERAQQERDGFLASTPADRCSMCHREILPFTHLPVHPDTTLLGHNTTELNEDWKETAVASVQCHNAGERISWTKVKIYSRAKGKVRRIYDYEVPYQPTRFYLPAQETIENPHNVLD